MDLIDKAVKALGGNASRQEALQYLSDLRDRGRKQLQEQIMAPTLNLSMDDRRELADMELKYGGLTQDQTTKVLRDRQDLLDAKKDRAIELIQGGQEIPADVTRQLSTDDTDRLRMLLDQRESAGKRRNTQNMIRNILGGAALLFN
jgi:enoyl reductase-like protein